MTLKISLVLFSLLLLASCNETDKLPSKEDAEKEGAKELPIDGLYIMTSKTKETLEKSFGVVGNDLYVRFQKGVVFYEDRGIWANHPDKTPGKVFIKNIKKVNSTKYKGTYLIPEYGLIKDTSFTVTILVDGNNLKINLPPIGPFKISQTVHFNLEE